MIMNYGLINDTSMYFEQFHMIHEIIHRGDVKIKKIVLNDNIEYPLVKAISQHKHDRPVHSSGVGHLSDWL